MTTRLAGKAPEDLAFPSRSGGPLRVGNFRRDWFDEAARAIGLAGLTPHELRHTAATLAIHSGANAKDLQAMLGHKDAALTLNRYGQHYDQRSAGVAARLSRAAEEAAEQRSRPGHPRAD